MTDQPSKGRCIARDPEHSFSAGCQPRSNEPKSVQLDDMHRLAGRRWLG
jgi:hypothetical protein